LIDDALADGGSDAQLDRDIFNDETVESFDSEESSSNLSSKLQVKSIKQTVENDRAQRQIEAKISTEKVRLCEFNIYYLKDVRILTTNISDAVYTAKYV